MKQRPGSNLKLLTVNCTSSVQLQVTYFIYSYRIPSRIEGYRTIPVVQCAHESYDLAGPRSYSTDGLPNLKRDKDLQAGLVLGTALSQRTCQGPSDKNNMATCELAHASVLTLPAHQLRRAHIDVSCGVSGRRELSPPAPDILQVQRKHERDQGVEGTHADKDLADWCVVEQKGDAHYGGDEEAEHDDWIEPEEWGATHVTLTLRSRGSRTLSRRLTLRALHDAKRTLVYRDSYLYSFVFIISKRPRGLIVFTAALRGTS
jgi:hypothetical protein